MSNQYLVPDPATICLSSSNFLFGSIAHRCSRNFHSALLLESSVLSILPNAAFLLVLPVRIFGLYGKDTKTVPSLIQTAKVTFAILLSICQLLLLVLFSLNASSRTQAWIASACLNFTAALGIVPLVYLEHTRSLKPSAILEVYFLFSLLFDLVRGRIFYHYDHLGFIAVSFSVVIGIKLCLLLLESQGKGSYLKSSHQPLSPESTSGIINRSFLWWLNGLLVKGYESSIHLKDLPELDRDLAAEALVLKMQRAWDQRSQPEGRLALVWAIGRCFRIQLLAAVFPRLCLIGFNFAQPFLITQTLDLLKSTDSKTSRNEGYRVIAATGFVYFGIAMSWSNYHQGLFRFVTMFRGAVIALIYNRTLSQPVGMYDDSAAITLMSTDVDTIATSLQDFNECWARLIEITIGIYLLARQIGWVCVIPLMVVALTSGGTSVVAKYIPGSQKVWIDAVQRRIAVTSSMLSEIKAIKMMGFSNAMTTLIQDYRVKETERMAEFRWWIVWLNVVSNIPRAIAPAATFAVYAIQALLLGSGSLETTQAFTSLAIITLVTNTTAGLLSSIPRTFASLGSFDRIQQFMLRFSWSDQRIYLPDVHSESPVDSASSLYRDVEHRHLPLEEQTLLGPQSTLRPYSEGETISSTPTDISDESDLDPELGSFNGAANSPGDYALIIKGADIRPTKDASFTVHHLTLRILRRSTTMIVGPVGAGKSTILKAILGEIACDRGSVSVVSRRIAYCAQTPWLPNCTIRQAICGMSDHPVINEQWYNNVLYACALDQDLSAIPGGDQTTIGSRGIILSGGQKQRIALARAVYSRYEVVLLDDILSALDRKTEQQVVDRLFGPDGLFRKHGSTVVLVTHANQHLPLADKIVVLSADGKVAQQGTFKDIKRDGFSSYVSPNMTQSASDQIDVNEIIEKAETLDVASDGEMQDLTRKSGDVALYKYYFKSIERFERLVFLSFVVVSVFCNSFSQIWLEWWTSNGGGRIGMYISIYFLLGIMNSVSAGGYIWAMAVVIACSTGRKFHYTLLQTVMKAPLSFFITTETGIILNRFSQDMTLIEGPLSIALLTTITNLCSTVAEAGLISTGSTYMALTLPFFGVALYGLQHFYLKTSRQLRFLDLETKSPVYTHFLETLDGLSSIRAFGWQEEAISINIVRLDASQKPYYLLYCIQRWLALVLDLIVGALAVIVVSLAMTLKTSSSAGLLGVSLNNILSFNMSLSSLITGWTMLETSLGAVARLRSFEADTKVEAQANENSMPPASWPSLGAIEILDMTATYNPSTTALRNISMKISPGQKVGLCGRTGSGKSSLIATLLRILELESGCILIDGLDLSTLPRETIRERLTTMPQDALHISGSVRLNADPLGSYTDDIIIAALTKSQLWDLLSNRGGLDADLSTNTLSEGQQQLFALSRAILRKSKVLLLDEATSNLDKESEQVMQKVLKDEFQGATVIAVAHRLESIMDADLIGVMEGGRLVEWGSPGELMGKDSEFRRMVGT